jgi:uncharacterized protein (TIGR02996 family)
VDDGSALLAALHAGPGDDLAWLALADALEEQGRLDQAELGRLLVRVRQEDDLSRRQRLEQRVRQLLALGVRAARPVVVNSLGMTFSLIPPGKFQMGSPPAEPGRFGDETPLHPVAITRAFYLAVHPVTQARYRAVMGRNPSAFAAGGEEGELVGTRDTSAFPVESVSWQDATAFCEALGRRPEEARARRRYRLPTEAEWEYACRGGILTPAPYYFGAHLLPEQACHDFRESDDDDTPVPTRLDYQPCPAPVGSYPPNAYGLFDMHGNVWEFCQDWFLVDYYAMSPPADPAGPEQGDTHVLRGGSWYSRPSVCRSACRNPIANHNTAGFRVLLVHPG